MKILIYIDSMSPAGGIERVVSKHMEFFIKKHDVVLLTKDKKKSFYDLPDDVNVHSLSIDGSMDMSNKIQRIFYVFKQLFLTRKELKKYLKECDFFYVTHIRNLLELYLSGVDMKKVIVTEHGSYYGYNDVYKKLKRWLYPKCGYVVSPTDMDYKIYESQDCNAFYIPNPLSFFNENHSHLNDKVVLNIGRFTNDKRQELLLSIWKEVSLEYPDWKLKLVGSGELKDKLISYVNENKLNDTVEFTEPVKNVEGLFLNSSIFAFTSKYEGFGMVLAEAMAYGVPCVCFDVPSGPRDIIDNGVDGFLVEDGDIEEYKNRLIFLISNFDKRKELGANAKFNIQKFLDVKVEAMWKELLQNNEC